MVKSENPKPHKIVFFDGICHLCNGFVDFSIQNETTQNQLAFAPLQGETAAKLLSTEDRANLNTVVFYDEGEVYRESTAVLRIFQNLKSPWRALGTLGFAVPKMIRDWIYRAVARNRYRWFGERDTCRLPLPHEKSQLLP